jgi:hypothetical protein
MKETTRYGAVRHQIFGLPGEPGHGREFLPTDPEVTDSVVYAARLSFLLSFAYAALIVRSLRRLARKKSRSLLPRREAGSLPPYAAGFGARRGLEGRVGPAMGICAWRSLPRKRALGQHFLLLTLDTTLYAHTLYVIGCSVQYV